MYPEIERRLAELIGRIAANDPEVAWINSGRVAKLLLSAELVARGLGGFVRNGPDAVHSGLLEHCGLFNRRIGDGVLWCPVGLAVMNGSALAFCRKSRKLRSPKNLTKICFQLPLLLQAPVGHVRSPVVAFL